MKKYNTVVFDMDGTILNTLEDLKDGVNAALREFHYPERSLDEVRRFVGNGVLRLMELAVPGGKEAPDFEEVFAYFKTYYAAHSQEKTRPYEGIIELMDELKRRGVAMAIVSNKFHEAVCDLNKLYFGDRITVAMGENEAKGIRKKPAPDTVYAALEELGADRSTAVYVGDSEVDYATSVNAGMDCIMVSWGFRERSLLESFDALAIADTPADILAYIVDKA